MKRNLYQVSLAAQRKYEIISQFRHTRGRFAQRNCKHFENRKHFKKKLFRGKRKSVKIMSQREMGRCVHCFAVTVIFLLYVCIFSFLGCCLFHQSRFICIACSPKEERAGEQNGQIHKNTVPKILLRELYQQSLSHCVS